MQERQCSPMAPSPQTASACTTSPQGKPKDLSAYEVGHIVEDVCANDFEFLTRVMAFGRENGLPSEDKPESIKAWSRPGAMTGGLNYYRANLASSAGKKARPPFAKIHVPTLASDIGSKASCRGSNRPPVSGNCRFRYNGTPTRSAAPYFKCMPFGSISSRNKRNSSVLGRGVVGMSFGICKGNPVFSTSASS